MNGQTRRALQLAPEEMRALGYRVIDMLVERLEHLDDEPIARKVERGVLEQLLREPVPEQGTDVDAVLRRLQEQVFNTNMQVDHPRFFAFVPSPNNFISVMADTLVAGLNIFVGTWMAGSGAAEVELVTLDWLRQLCGLPESAGGLFVSGGSMANLTALAVARHVKLADQVAGAVVYCSDQTHTAVDRGLRVLGFAPSQICKLASDDGFRLALPDLRRAVAEDRAAGRRPFCVIANAGTTNTAAVDPLAELADFCRAEDVWLHADGAYGAPAILCDQGRSLLGGLGEVDSLSIDPHKWLFQPFETGCLLVRDGVQLRDTFRILPAYLRDVHRFEEEINFCDYGIQLTRGFRALKLWMSLQVFGLDAFRDAVAWGIALAERAERRLREAGGWMIVTPAQLGIVTFRYAPEGRTVQEIDAINQRIADALYLDGFAALTTTTLRARLVLRLCTINPRTSEADIDETIACLDRLGRAAVEQAQ